MDLKFSSLKHYYGDSIKVYDAVYDGKTVNNYRKTDTKRCSFREMRSYPEQKKDGPSPSQRCLVGPFPYE